MILVIILTIAVFITWLLIPHKLTRNVLGTLSSILLILIIIGIVANMTNHFGMKKKTLTSQEEKIYSAGSSKSPTNILIANEIGKNTNNYVMVYKNHPKDKKATAHFKPNMNKDKLSESVKTKATYHLTQSKNATIQTKKTYWVWKSNFYKFLFKFGSEDNKQLIKSRTIAKIPKDTWVVLNASEANKLKQQQNKQQNPGSQQKIRKIMQAKTLKYKKAHPQASKQQLENYLEQEKSKLATKQIKEQLK